MLLIASLVAIVSSKVSIRTVTVAELLTAKPVERVEVAGIMPVSSVKFTKKTSKVIFSIADTILAPPTNRVTIIYIGKYPERLAPGCKVTARGTFAATFSEFNADSLETECGKES